MLQRSRRAACQSPSLSNAPFPPLLPDASCTHNRCQTGTRIALVTVSRIARDHTRLTSDELLRERRPDRSWSCMTRTFGINHSMAWIWPADGPKDW